MKKDEEEGELIQKDTFLFSGGKNIDPFFLFAIMPWKNKRQANPLTWN